MGCSFIASVQKAAGAVLRPVAQIASVIPGPWQVPALAASAIDSAVHGNVLGAIANGVGAFGAGGGFTSAGFDTSKLTNPGGLFSTAGSAVPYSGSGISASGGGVGFNAGGGTGINPTALSSVGLSSTGTPLYSASQLASTFPGAFSEGDLASLGGGLFSQSDLAAKFPGAYSATTTSGGITDTLGNLLGKYGANILSTAAQLGGGYLQGQAASDAAATSAQAQIRAAQIAADAAKFRPVGVTTNFGSSNFGYDQNGNLINAGYSLSPLMQGQQNSLLGASNPLLKQFTDAQANTAPMGQSAQTLFNLGQGYLSTSPQQQAQKYYQDQMALLQPSNERTLAELQNTLQQQGRMGLATGGTSTMAAANPALEAYYNALLQQQNQLAANATQGGMDYTKFGAGVVGTGGDLLNSMFNTQRNAFQPYQTALGGAQTIEGLGQNAMDLGINIGAKGTASNAQSGALLAQGMTNAANTIQENASSPWGTLLSGAGKIFQNYQNQQTAPIRFDPYTGKALT